MKKQTVTTSGGISPENRPAFDVVKREYENALASGADTAAPLTALSQSVAYSVINRTIDPQRTAAVNSDTVSDSGCNPALVELRRGIRADLTLLENTRRNADAAFRLTYDADGDLTEEVEDPAAAAVLTSGKRALIAQTLTDGIDLVQTAALAILEQAADHAASGGEWLDTPYTVRRLSKKVYIQAADSAAYKEVQTTPIQEVFRAVRRAIASSRAMQIDPRNGYTYLEEMTEDGNDTIYHRLRKWEDLGGEDMHGLYTADRETVIEYENALEKLRLTARQAQIIRLRMQGRGAKQIATYLGISVDNVKGQIKEVRRKAAKIGLTPDSAAGEE